MQPYTPEALPLSHLDYQRLIRAVGRANAGEPSSRKLGASWKI